jgi:hypothetical protein
MVYRIGTTTPRSPSPTPTVSSCGLSSAGSVSTPRNQNHENPINQFIQIIKEEIQNKFSEVSPTEHSLLNFKMSIIACLRTCCQNTRSSSKFEIQRPQITYFPDNCNILTFPKKIQSLFSEWKIVNLASSTEEKLVSTALETIDEEAKTYKQEIAQNEAPIIALIEGGGIQKEINIKQNTLEKLIESFRNDDSENDKSKEMISRINGLEIDPKLMRSLIENHYSNLEQAFKHINNSVYFDEKKKKILAVFQTNEFNIEKALIPDLFETKAGKALTNLLQIKSINLSEASAYTLSVPYGSILPDIIERYEEENTNKRPSNNTLLLEMHEFGWSILKGIPKFIYSSNVQTNYGAKAQIKQDMNELSSDEKFWIACFDFIIERRKANQQGMPSEKEMELLKNIIKRQANVLFKKEQL